MLASPSSSPRVVLAQCTNTIRTPQPRLTPYLPTPPTNLKKSKRPHVGEHKPTQKRQKFDVEDTSNSDSDSDGDAFMADVVVQPLARKKTAFQRHRQFMMDSALRFQRHARAYSPISFTQFIYATHVASTLPILKSLVSSNKSDLFKCHSVGEDTYLTPPYACSYSHRESLHLASYITLNYIRRFQSWRDRSSSCCNGTGNCPCPQHFTSE
jgi:denticleless